MANTLVVLLMVCAPGQTEPPQADTTRGERMIDAYFHAETARLRDACLADVKSLDDWKARRETYRSELLEMLGLDPMPPRTDLKATVTGTLQRERFRVEKLHFQSRPGLYVTCSLYVPKGLDKPAPAILYVCGHGRSKKGDVSFGSKVAYQRHGCWFAQNGYVCLTIDTLQLGEIEGIHHGTYRYGMWWWNNRGYTPAGVEAFNCIRALDYLQSRPEVDPKRIGVTGRSGGGAYSWWIAAIDERIKAAVPVAGITDLENHVVDGCVEGHCDCMYFVNTYRWDYPLVAALVAPRPLMIGNSDNDRIFPLDGVKRTYEQARRIYDLYGAADQVTLNITEGPHKDTPELRIPAFRWFNKHLKGEDPPVEDQAEGLFEPEELKVFDELPADQINTDCHETFVKAADPPPVPRNRKEWESMRDGWRKALLEKCFRGWPDEPDPLNIQEISSEERDGMQITVYEFNSQEHVRLQLLLKHRAGEDDIRLVTCVVPDAHTWSTTLAVFRGDFREAVARIPEGSQEKWSRRLGEASEYLGKPHVAAVLFAPRGIGPTAWKSDERYQTQIRRRFMLLGQTLDGMRIWDVRRAIQAIRSLDSTKDADLVLVATRDTGAITLYATLFEPDIRYLRLSAVPPATHREGPFLLNVRRYLDIPQAVAMAAEGTAVSISAVDPEAWEYPRAVADRLGWEGRIEVRPCAGRSLVPCTPGDPSPSPGVAAPGIRHP